MTKLTVPYMSEFTLRKKSYGYAVYSKKFYSQGSPIMRFTGKIIHYKDLPAIENESDDRYVQVGPKSYMGPSGGQDDLVNHSCEPTAGLRFTNNEIMLIAIVDIKPGDEITWDYSTTMDEDDWEMDCECGSSRCRRRIRDFKHLPLALRHRYARLGIVPPYLLKFL